MNLKGQERERKSNEHHCTFRSLLIYVKTGQITFKEGNHCAIKLENNVIINNRIISENSVATSEADCQHCWVRVTILRDKQRFPLKEQHKLAAFYKSESTAVPPNLCG